MVVLGHQVGLSRKNFTYNPKILNLLELHHYGVQVFFVISGFIITRLLIAEREEQGTVSLRNFYVRRIFRIIPAYYFFLLAVLVISRVSTACIVDDRHFIKAFLFMSNFRFWSGSWPLEHTWTLAIEEQFYLLWPLLFKKNYLKFVPLFFICTAPLFRIIGYLHPGWVFHLSFIVNADAIFWGGLFAIYFETPVFHRFMKYGKWILAATGVMLLCERFAFHGAAYLTVPFLRTFFCLSIIILIYYSLNKESRLYKFFNMPALVYIGVLSYSIYLWQQLFYYKAPVFKPSFVTTFPYSWLFIFAISWLSYRFIEQPFLKLRTRFIRKPKPGSTELKNAQGAAMQQKEDRPLNITNETLPQNA